MVMPVFVTFYSRESSKSFMPDADTERKYQIPDSVLDHLTAAHDHAESDQALYHIREALQITESEIGSVDAVGETASE